MLGRFTDIHHLIPDADNTFDAVLFDVGTSSMQADTAERGFSVSREGPLDMRLDGVRYCSVVTTYTFMCNIIMSTHIYYVRKNTIIY